MNKGLKVLITAISCVAIATMLFAATPTLKTVGNELQVVVGPNDADIVMKFDDSKNVTIPSGATFSNSSGGSFATPTGSVNGVATAGTATTATRSDGAPKLANPLTPTAASGQNAMQAVTGQVQASLDIATSTTLRGTALQIDSQKWTAIVSTRGSFDSGTSSDTTTAAACTANSEVFITPLSTTTAPAGLWTVNPGAGSFTVYSWSDDNATSAVTQAAAIAFMYVIFE